MAGICARAGTFVYESHAPLFLVPFALGDILGPPMLGPLLDRGRTGGRLPDRRCGAETLEDVAGPLTVVRRRVPAAMPAATR